MRLAASLAAVCCLVATLAAGVARAQTFSLNGIAFGPSSYLSAEQLDAVAGDYVGRPIAFDDLTEMLGRIKQLYLLAGVPTAEAILPPQEIRDGVLRVELIEARIDGVEFEGLETTDPGWLRERISLVPGEKPDFERIATDLRRFDIAHDISPSLEFKPGATVGTTRATITVDEPDPWTFTLSADNFGRPETGENRLSLFGRWSSVTGVRDTLSFRLEGPRGARSGSIGYSRPVGASGGRVIGAATFAESSIIGGTFGSANIVSNTTSGSLSYRTPWRVQPTSHWILEGGVTYERSESEIAGIAFSDIAIADTILTGRYHGRVGEARVYFGAGVRAGNTDAEGTTQTEGSFALLFGDAGYSRVMGEAAVLDVTAAFQLAPDENLPVARLFTAGGVSTVRGYPSDVRAGDSGAVVNLQLTRREAWNPSTSSGMAVRPFGFVDLAAVVPFRVDGGFDADQDFLASVGGGLSAAFGESFAALVMVGIPLVDTLGFENSGTPEFYLGLDYNF